MKRFLIDFLLAFLIIIGIFGLSGNSKNDINKDYYEGVIKNEDDEIENIKDYDGNLINRISFKFNTLIQSVADYGFDKFKDMVESFLE